MKTWKPSLRECKLNLGTYDSAFGFLMDAPPSSTSIRRIGDGTKVSTSSLSLLHNSRLSAHEGLHKCSQLRNLVLLLLHRVQQKRLNRRLRRRLCWRHSTNSGKPGGGGNTPRSSTDIRHRTERLTTARSRPLVRRRHLTYYSFRSSQAHPEHHQC